MADIKLLRETLDWINSIPLSKNNQSIYNDIDQNNYFIDCNIESISNEEDLYHQLKYYLYKWSNQIFKRKSNKANRSEVIHEFNYIKVQLKYERYFKYWKGLLIKRKKCLKLNNIMKKMKYTYKIRSMMYYWYQRVKYRRSIKYKAFRKWIVMYSTILIIPKVSIVCSYNIILLLMYKPILIYLDQCLMISYNIYN